VAMTAHQPNAAVTSPNGHDDQTIGELVAIASRDVSLLIRKEVELAKAEVKSAAVSAGLGVAFLGGAAFLGFFSFFAVTFAAAEGLHATGLGRAYAYLIVTGAYLVVAGLLVLFAVGRLKKVGPPKRAIQTVKDDVSWMRHPTTAPTPRLENR
jgi:Putative Actinobacterial Holin-X, holin superfamily III